VVTDLLVFAVPGIPEIAPEADLGRVIAEAVRSAGTPERAIRSGDVFVVAQKIVSKAEDAVVRLDSVTPSPLAHQWAAATRKDPRCVEIVLAQSKRIVRMDRNVLITETHHGFVCANAGVDTSNVPSGWVTVLPGDPDRSAELLRAALSEEFACPVGVIIADTFGRPWREGIVNVAIGVAGLQPLVDYRGCVDSHGHRLESTVVALADEIAGAAEIVMRKTAGRPVAVVRGVSEWIGEGSARTLVREAERDLFR